MRFTAITASTSCSSRRSPDSAAKTGWNTSKSRAAFASTADFAVVGVGVIPNTDFLDGSGIEPDNGVVVNERFETTAPGLYAAGDVANFFDPFFARQRRIEHWSNANYQGTEVGKILAGRGDGYDNVSSFFSEVFGVGVKVFGDVSRFDELTADGTLESGLLASYGEKGRLVGALTVGQSEDVEALAERSDFGAGTNAGATRQPRRGRGRIMSRLEQLSKLGQSVWIDFLSRDLLDSGALARAVRDDAVVGVTSNPTIFAKALARGDHYDAQLASHGGGDAKRAFLALAMRDVANACDLLRPVWERTEGATATSRSRSTRTSPTTPKPRSTRRRSCTQRSPSRTCSSRSRQPTPACAAIEEMTARGRSINVTLIFSLTRHRQVIEAYLRGLERLVAAGGDPSRVHSVASFFVSRVDTETDRRLDELGRDDLKGAPRNRQRQARLPAVQGAVPGERWEALAARGATKQRCLWASTSTKDPSLRDTLYVEELIGPETISTMPEETIRAFQDHGRVESRARDRARRGAASVQPAVRRRRRLRRRRRHTRARGNRQVRRLVQRTSRWYRHKAPFPPRGRVEGS